MLNRIIGNIPGLLLLFLLLFSFYVVENKWFKCKNEKIVISDSLWIKYGPIAKKYFPDSYSVSGEKKEVKKIYNLKSEYLGCLIVSKDIGIKVYGYAGEIPIIIVISPFDQIEGVLVQSHNETPNFYAMVEKSGILSTWDKMHINNALNLEVDAVSGATFTSKAIIISVKKSLSWYTKIQETDKMMKWSVILKWIALILILIFAICHFALPHYFKKNRILLHVSSIIIFGFWTGNFISIAILYNWLLHGINFSIATFLSFLFILSLILPIISGKAFYCNFVCPYGACQEITSIVPIKKINLSAKKIKWFRFIRLMMFYILIIILSSLSFTPNLSLIEPFQAFLIKSASLFSIAFASIFIIASIFIHKPWCNYFCMTGQFLEFFRQPKLFYSKLIFKNSNYSVLILIILFTSILLLSMIL